MSYVLNSPVSAAQWQAFHDIRRQELFEARGRFGVYDAAHPDDRDPRNQPLLLTLESRPLGTVRLDDFGDGTGCIRLVAVAAAEQGKGHGRVMEELVEATARQRGIHTLYVNSAPAAVGFYEKTGWERHVWDAAELTGIAADCVQMRKRL